MSDQRPALFLDRDGVINIDHGYVYRPEDFDFIEGVFDLCRAAQHQGYRIIIITNQAGIGRGYYSEADFASLTNWMLDRFSDNDIKIDGVYYSPYHPVHGIGAYKVDAPCRKPRPGMILQAAVDHAIDLGQSLLIGDKVSDIQAGQAAGVGRLILFQESPDDDDDAQPNVWRASNLKEIVTM